MDNRQRVRLAISMNYELGVVEHSSSVYCRIRSELN
jgi:hypothetical protein